VRNGLDVVRALAMGARGVMIGRAWTYAVTAQGEAGLSTLLARFKSEMRVAMGLSGVTSVGAIGADLLNR